MEVIELLAEEAAEQGILVTDEDLARFRVDALYLEVNGAEHIALSRAGTVTDRTCWLAEELGHHYNRPGRVLQYNTPEDWRAEARARRWAHQRLLPLEVVQAAARRADGDDYEMAEDLGVTVQFLREAVDDYQSRGIWTTLVDTSDGC